MLKLGEGFPRQQASLVIRKIFVLFGLAIRLWLKISCLIVFMMKIKGYLWQSTEFQQAVANLKSENGEEND